jgi:DNA invertase Pin-like site-specific DNA recombinase
MTNTKSKHLRYGAYHRVSQANGRSLDDETTMTDKAAFEQIEGWAKLHGIEIVERYLDWDKTGSKLNRPELSRMLDDLRAGVIDGIAVAKTDRLSRAKTGDALKLVGEIQEIKPGSLALLDLGVDPTTPTGEMMLTILLAFSRMQWRQFKEAWQDVQARAVKRGVWIGPAPFGYERNDDGQLHPHPEWAPVVTVAFETAANGGMHAAMALLAERAPSRRWRTTEVRKLLHSRTYLGENRGTVGSHTALVSPAVWQAAQTEPRSRRTNGDYPLSGVASCGRCGSPLIGGTNTVKGRTYRRMRCSNETCRGVAIQADNLEAYVRSMLKAQLGDMKFRQRFDVHGLEPAQAKLEAAETELQLYVANTRVSVVGPEVYRVGVQARQAEIDKASGALVGLDTRSRRQQTLPCASELDDDKAFRRAVELATEELGPLTVSPGRGAVADRLPSVWRSEAVPGRAGR